MVLRKLAVALISVGVLLPGLSHALAIGDIRTKSALNEPFSGEAELTDVGDLSADEIKVGLATQEEFDQLGIEKVGFLNEMSFEVVKRDNGTAVVRITTSRAVAEPYLDFVVRVSWPGNTSLKSMTALLDPPSSHAAAPVVTKPVVAQVTAPAPVVPAVTSVPAPAVPQAPTPAPVSKPVPVAPAPVAERSVKRQAASVATTPAAPKKESAAPGTYKTKAGEGLWGVALKVRPSRDLTLHQTMIAIERANPAAFPTSNINVLSQGKILNIPSDAQIREISAKEADESVLEQNQSWKHLTAQAPQKGKLEAAQVNATAKHVEAAKPAVAPKSEMKLVTPESGKNAVSTGAKEETRPNKAAEQKLATKEKQVVAVQQENAKLGTEVKGTEAKLKENAAKLKLQDAQLAELQNKLKEKQAAAQEAKAAVKPAVAPAKAPEPVKPAVPAEKVEAPKPVAAKPAEVKPAEVKAAETKPAATQPAEKPTPKAATVKPVEPAAPAPEEGMSSSTKITLGLLGLLGTLAAGIGGLIWYRRRSNAYAQSLDLDEIESLEDGHADVSMFHTASPTGSLESELDDLDLGHDETLLSAAATPLVDPLEEADAYIRNGRYPQAIGYLTKAVAASPDRADLRVKLLECFAATGDHEGFALQEAELESLGDLDALARAEDLKAAMPAVAAPAKSRDDHGGIDFAPATLAEEELPSLEDLEMDFNQSVSLTNLKALDVEPETLAPEQDKGLDFGDLDFNLETQAKESKDEFALEEGLGDEAIELELPEAGDAALDLELDQDLSLDEGLEFSLPEAEHAEAVAADLDFDLSTHDFAPEPKVEASSADHDFGEIELELPEDFSFTEAQPETPSAVRTQELPVVAFEEPFGAEVEEPAEAEASLALEAEPASLDFDLDESFTAESAPLEKEGGLDLGDLDLADLGEISLPESHEESVTAEDLDFSLDDLEVAETLEPLPVESLDLSLPESLTEVEEPMPAVEESSVAEASLELEPELTLDDLQGDFSLAEEEPSPLELPLTQTPAPSIGGAAAEFDLALHDELAPVVEAEAVAEIPEEVVEEELTDLDMMEDLGGDFDFLADADENATKLDLAKAYIDMGDVDGAKEILNEVVLDGSGEQQEEAKGLLAQVG